ncbi:MAG: hypothetical protein KDC49_01720 [Saprospiraceae bacterium]|nr:hypothetical protein [Saprospiraceae bacterium]
MKNKISLEVVSILITLVLLVLILFPIAEYYGEGYRFYTSNILFIIVFLTYTRYIFLLKYTFLADLKWFKVVLVFLSIPLILYGVDRLLEFQSYLDEVGFVDISGNDIDEASKMATYTKSQYVFFNSAALIVLVIMPFRMIMSVWRIVNKKGTV